MASQPDIPGGVPGTQPVTARQRELLFTVCRDYITSGTASSSSGLVRAHGLQWSSATVRQELAVLERNALLQRAHHSSGRVPTRLGMQYYVAGLPKSPGVRAELAAAVDHSLRDAGRSRHDPDHHLRAASRVLSEVAGCVAVSFVGSPRVGRIQSIEVVPLVSPRLLVLLRFDDGASVMRPVSLCGDDSASAGFPRRGERLQERLRQLCEGRTLPEAYDQLRRLRREQESHLDRCLAEALRIGLLVCAGSSLDPLWLQVAGQPKLARNITGDTASLGDVLELFEDYRRLADVLCQLLPRPQETLEARVRVSVPIPMRTPSAGQEAGNSGPLELTLVGCRFGSAHPPAGQQAPLGAVALLGSDRMDYAALIPLVEYAARTLAAHTGT